MTTPLSHSVSLSTARRLSGLERLWLVADLQHPPFVNQMVLEGDGCPVPPRPWNDVVAGIAAAQPAVRARLHGHLANCRWEADGPLPAVRELDAPEWRGDGPEGAPFLAAGLDAKRGPTCEILVLRGASGSPESPTRVVLRTHHALMDGQGTMLFARALFAALRGEQSPRAELGPTNDAILARRLGVAAEKPVPVDSVAPQGAADGSAMRVTWMRRRVEGPVSVLLPRIALALAGRVAIPPGRTFRVAIPVDMRAHAPGLSSSANLTGLFRLDVAEHLRAGDPLASLGRALKEGVVRADVGANVVASEFARFLPLRFMGWVARWGARQALRQERYNPAAILSNLGRLRMDEFSGAGFGARHCFFIPPGNPGLPLFLSTTGDASGVELCATVPQALATHGRLAAMLDALEAALKDSAPGETPRLTTGLPPP